MKKIYKIITDDQIFEEALAHLEVSDLVAFDTETDGLNPRKNKVIGFSFSGSEGYGYYLPREFPKRKSDDYPCTNHRTARLDTR